MSSDHDLIYGTVKICEVIQTPPDRVPQFYRSYNHINYDQLYHDVEVQNWSAIFEMPDPDEQIQHFNAIVSWLLDLHAPLRKYIKKDEGANPWFTFNIEKAMVERNIAYRVWKIRRTDHDRNRYKEQRKRVNYMVREAKRMYMKRHLDPNLPPKKLWRNLDKIGAKDSADNNIIFTPDQLNTYFSTPRPSSSTSGNYSRASRAEFSFDTTFDLEVFNAIHYIKSNAVGMDGIPVKFIKILLPLILPYITHIFNTILTTSKFPETWKTSKIMPIAKNNNPESLADYRPISILPALSKALEFIVRKQITSYVERNGMISPYQSGFRSNHSTSTALLKITNDLLIASEEKCVSVLLLLDFSKAFDSVDHQLLCDKLAIQYGFTSCAVTFIKSYLSQRMQCVWVNGGSSECLPVDAGVVQGSVLGPLLFTLFINDIVNQISFCRYHLYADDVQLYISSRPEDFSDCIARLNEDLSNIHQWTVANSLFINSSKSQALVVNPNISATLPSPQINLGGNPIACFEKVKSLGLIVNQNLTWSDQISKICRNVFYTLKRLWPMAHFTPIETRKKLVTSLIIPQFLYCDVIFSKTASGQRDKLKVAINSCARYIYSVPRYQHISQFTNRILGVPLDTYYSYRICCMMHKLIRTGGPRYLFEELQFGHSIRLFNLITPAHRTASRASSFFVQGAILWNGLPSSVRREYSVGRFKEGCLSSLSRSEDSSSG
jgi:Reverse transcriptase (RNA-dependent DNA polymerase)